MKHLGKEIAKVRVQKELSLRDVAERTKLSHQAVANVEDGEGRLETAFRIAKVLGIKGARLVQLATLDVTQLARSA